MTTTVHELKTIINSFHSIVCIETVEEDRATELVKEAARSTRLVFSQWTATTGVRGNVTLGELPETKNPEGLFQFIEDYPNESIYALKDFVPFLTQSNQERRFREIAQKFQKSRSTLFLIGPQVQLPSELKHMSIYFDLNLPSKEELAEVIQSTYKSISRHKPVELDLPKKELNTFLDALSGLTLNQARQIMAYVMLENFKFDESDLKKVLEKKARSISDGGMLEYYPVEANQFSLGGFSNLKKWIQRARVGFSQEAQNLNLPSPSGILMVGVPGCGKSLAAKVIAKEWKVPLLKLDAGRLFDKYIGESEKNFRKAIQMAEAMAPCILWMDEIEKAMSTVSDSDNDGGLSRRLFGAFLTWLQEKKAPVFVVATANNIDRLPTELLRKGRFDEIFFVDLPTEKERREIFQIHIQLRNLSPEGFDLEHLVTSSDGYSGSEIEQCIIAAAYRSIHEKSDLNTALIEEEIAATHPISQSRRQDIEHLRSKYKSLFMNVTE